MQAHLLSSPAARITSTSHPTRSSTSHAASIPLTTQVLRPNPVAPLSVSPSPSLADTVGLAHDAGNLLAALGLYSDLLSVPGVLRPEHQHYATELSLISNRSSELIQRLLASQLSVSPHSPQTDDSAPASLLPVAHSCIPRPIKNPTLTSDPSLTLRQLAPVLQRIAAGTAKVSIICPNSLPHLNLPPDVLERITVNLVRNAADAIRIQRSTTYSAALPHCGEIRVALAVVGPHLELTVEDNGPGMPPAIAAEFLHPTPLPQGATRGLGHRVIHELATCTAAQVAIRILPGSGTIFSVHWPIPSLSLPDPLPIDAPLDDASDDASSAPSIQS